MMNTKPQNKHEVYFIYYLRHYTYLVYITFVKLPYKSDVHQNKRDVYQNKSDVCQNKSDVCQNKNETNKIYVYQTTKIYQNKNEY